MVDPDGIADRHGYPAICGVPGTLGEKCSELRTGVNLQPGESNTQRMDRKTRGRPQDATAAPAPASLDHDDKVRTLRGAWSTEGCGTDSRIAERRRERDLEDRGAARRPIDRP